MLKIKAFVKNIFSDLSKESISVESVPAHAAPTEEISDFQILLELIRVMASETIQPKCKKIIFIVKQIDDFKKTNVLSKFEIVQLDKLLSGLFLGFSNLEEQREVFDRISDEKETKRLMFEIGLLGSILAMYCAAEAQINHYFDQYNDDMLSVFLKAMNYPAIETLMTLMDDPQNFAIKKLNISVDTLVLAIQIYFYFKHTVVTDLENLKLHYGIIPYLKGLIDNTGVEVFKEGTTQLTLRILQHACLNNPEFFFAVLRAEKSEQDRFSPAEMLKDLLLEYVFLHSITYKREDPLDPKASDGKMVVLQQEESRHGSISREIAHYVSQECADFQDIIVVSWGLLWLFCKINSDENSAFLETLTKNLLNKLMDFDLEAVNVLNHFYTQLDLGLRIDFSYIADELRLFNLIQAFRAAAPHYEAICKIEQDAEDPGFSWASVMPDPELASLIIHSHFLRNEVCETVYNTLGLASQEPLYLKIILKKIEHDLRAMTLFFEGLYKKSEEFIFSGLDMAPQMAHTQMCLAVMCAKKHFPNSRRLFTEMEPLIVLALKYSHSTLLLNLLIPDLSIRQKTLLFYGVFPFSYCISEFITKKIIIGHEIEYLSEMGGTFHTNDLIFLGLLDRLHLGYPNDNIKKNMRADWGKEYPSGALISDCGPYHCAIRRFGHLLNFYMAEYNHVKEQDEKKGISENLRVLTGVFTHYVGENKSLIASVGHFKSLLADRLTASTTMWFFLTTSVVFQPILEFLQLNLEKLELSIRSESKKKGKKAEKAKKLDPNRSSDFWFQPGFLKNLITHIWEYEQGNPSVAFPMRVDGVSTEELSELLIFYFCLKIIKKESISSIVDLFNGQTSLEFMIKKMDEYWYKLYDLHRESNIAQGVQSIMSGNSLWMGLVPTVIRDFFWPPIPEVKIPSEGQKKKSKSKGAKKKGVGELIFVNSLESDQNQEEGESPAQITALVSQLGLHHDETIIISAQAEDAEQVMKESAKRKKKNKKKKQAGLTDPGSDASSDRVESTVVLVDQEDSIQTLALHKDAESQQLLSPDLAAETLSLKKPDQFLPIKESLISDQIDVDGRLSVSDTLSLVATHSEDRSSSGVSSDADSPQISLFIKNIPKYRTKNESNLLKALSVAA